MIFCTSNRPWLNNEAVCVWNQTQSIPAIKEYKLKQSWNAKWALPAKLKISDCFSHHWIAVVLGKRKEDMPVSWIAKKAAAAAVGYEASSDRWIHAPRVLHSVKLPWNHPLSPAPRLVSHYSNYWSPLQQAKQISFWLKTEPTGWKLESLMAICTYWGTLDVSMPSPVTFTNLMHTARCIKFFFNFLSLAKLFDL